MGSAGPIPSYYPGAPQWVLVPPGPPAPSVELDGPVLSNLQVAAAIALIGAGLGAFIEFGLGPVFNFNVATALTAGGVTAASVLYDLEVLAVVSVALSITSFYFLRSAFARVAPVDEELRTPSSLALVAIVGYVIVVLGLLVLIQALVVTLNCVGATRPAPSSCLDAGLLFEGLGVIVLGGILAIIGVIGIVIGVWRLGTRYKEDLLHVGAVLSIIPLLNVVGQVLIFYGAYKVRQRLGGPGRPANLQTLGY
jgi:hypothetical protein